MLRASDEPITSLENPQVRLARSLLGSAGRRRQGAFLVEGVRLVGAAMAAAVPRLVLYVPGFGQRDARERALLRAAQRTGCPMRPVTPQVLARVTDTVTPQGIVAVMPLPDDPPAILDDRALLLILDAVGDPGNAGTLLRTAAGVGVTAVVATKGTVDLYAPKVVRAGAGAHFLLDVRTDQEWEDFALRLPRACQVLLADAGAATPYWDVDWTRATALIVGSEAHGASSGAREAATGSVSIPTRGIESLNAAVAGSVILFEAARQRQTRAQGSEGRDPGVEVQRQVREDPRVTPRRVSARSRRTPARPRGGRSSRAAGGETAEPSAEYMMSPERRPGGVGAALPPGP